MQETYIKALQAKRIWNIDFVTQLTKNISVAKNLMTSYVKREIVSSVRRNLYVANDLTTGLPMVDKYEIASNITDDSFVAFHSALEYYGLGHQQSFNTYVGSSKRFRNFGFDGLDYVFCANKIQEGVVTPHMNALVRVTDLERTVVDCIDKPDLAGGCEELMNCLSSCFRLNVEKLIHYAKLYDKKVLYRKLGMICEIFSEQWKVNAEDIRLLRDKSGNNILDFSDRQESNKFLKTWRMNVPEHIINYINDNEADELI